MGMREISVAATGVVLLEGLGAGIIVNGYNLITQLENAVKAAKPETDHMGQFAARVVVTVELLGDLEENADDQP